VSKKLQQDLMRGPGSLSPTPHQLTPARRDERPPPTGPPDQLSPEIILALRQAGLPCDRLILNVDLVRTGIFPKNDRNTIDRMKGIGFPRGFYFRPNRLAYWPADVAKYLIDAPEANGRGAKPVVPLHLRASFKYGKNKTKTKPSSAAGDLTETT
jgi:hypothetical protein